MLADSDDERGKNKQNVKFPKMHDLCRLDKTGKNVAANSNDTLLHSVETFYRLFL